MIVQPSDIPDKRDSPIDAIDFLSRERMENVGLLSKCKKCGEQVIMEHLFCKPEDIHIPIYHRDCGGDLEADPRNLQVFESYECEEYKMYERWLRCQNG